MFPRIPHQISKWRIDKFISTDFFADVNLQSVLWHRSISDAPHIELAIYSAPDLQRPTFEHVRKQTFRPFGRNEQIGPSWSTHWFHVRLHVPDDWPEQETVFTFDSSCEALVYSGHGVPLQGLTGGNGGERHVDFVLDKRTCVYYVEVACNGLFGMANGGITPPDPNRHFALGEVRLAQPNKEAFALLYDMQILKDAANKLDQNSAAAWAALKAANQAMDAFQTGDPTSIHKARDAARDTFLGIRGASAHHKVYAIGNCHIDTAWLWPYDETRRKTARSWSRQLVLMDKYPGFKFAASQMQQFQWLEQDYPKLFAKIKHKVQRGQFIPIGGTWVEMDCNIPSGESLCRQFLFGQRYLLSRFGMVSKVFWLPDTFGYAAQLPQIIQQSGAKYFFTQKLSWNNINKFPNTTFYWQGLDGSRVLTHMAPSETYVAQCTVEELKKSVDNNRDKAYTDASLLVYGNGDGGGGPLPAMIERLHRMRDVDGIPPVEMASVDDFYEHVERTSTELVVWTGELYFELHRGTYTTHADMKRGNRTSETLLRQIEWLSTLAHLKNPSFAYPRDKINQLWELVLLNQFHDVLPGSSIEMVYKDANAHYAHVEREGKALLQHALAEVGTTHDEVWNALSWEREGVVCTRHAGAQEAMNADGTQSGQHYAYMHAVPAGGVKSMAEQRDPVPRVHTSQLANGHFQLTNAFLSIQVDAKGYVVSVVDLSTEEKRELIPTGARGNAFCMYEDAPIFWDAWDVEIYHLLKKQACPASRVAILEHGPLSASLVLDYALSEVSTMRQVLSLKANARMLESTCHVKWNENRQFLKVEFPVDVHNDHATYETQFGFVRRPTHYNTSWDDAKFEVCGHRWADLSEHGYGVSLLNDCKYGYSIHGNIMALSLLRAPKNPDAHADMGDHTFRFGLYVHASSFQDAEVVKQAAWFNEPLIAVDGAGHVTGSTPRIHVDNAPTVVLDTVKMAEDDESIVLRMYESMGGRGRARVHW
jgi:alpha-mannosidase